MKLRCLIWRGAPAPLRVAGSALTLAMLLAGCSDGDGEVAGGSTPGKTGSLNVVQGGAQDFAEFRAVVESGGVPAESLLDPVGFFAEHAVDLPPADCGLDLCIHSSLAVAPRFDGSNWTMAFVAMNTPLDPDTLERPPLHLVVALERSNEVLAPRAELLAGLQAIADRLRPEDRLSLVGFDLGAETLLAATAPAAAGLGLLVYDATAHEQVSLYQGLAGAARELDTLEGYAQRIVLVTSGRSHAGITDPARIVGLGEALAKGGVALGLVGYSAAYDSSVVSELGSLGAGTYSYATSPQDLQQALALEADTTLFPLATDFRLQVSAADGYRVGRIYGAKRASRDPDGHALLSLPALFIGQREGADDDVGGRRGGGGGLFVELIADAPEGIGANAPAFSTSASWQSSTGAPQATDFAVPNQLAPGQNPEGMWWSLSDPERGKPFMMLNMYLALRATVALYAGGDCARARGVTDMLAPAIEGWQAEFHDDDVDADYLLLLQLHANVEDHCSAHGPLAPPVPPNDFDGGCGFL